MSGEVLQCHDDGFMGHYMLLSRRLKSISRMTKIFVMLALEVFDLLMLRTGTELSGDPPSNVLNMVLFSASKRRFDYM